MRCIDKNAECACPEGQEYCPKSGECVEGGCPMFKCPDDKVCSVMTMMVVILLMILVVKVEVV